MIGILDIGSNSIRTMTAANTDGVFTCSDKRVFTTRLAEGLLASGALSEARMAQSMEVIRAFAREMASVGAPCYAYATSAVRDAKNRDTFVSQVRAIIGDRIAVLSGEQEARYAFRAATAGVGGGMIDIGGGSTQLVCEAEAVSVPFGCVRAKDVCPSGRLDEVRAALTPVLTQAFSGIPRFPVSRWSGVGGTITTLAAYCLNAAAYDKRAVSGAQISCPSFEHALRSLDALGGERASVPLLKRRHDVILQGGAILLFLMEMLAIDTLRISDADGMEGYAAHLLSRP